MPRTLKRTSPRLLQKINVSVQSKMAQSCTNLTESIAQTYSRVAPMIASKKVANNIMKWNNVQHETGSEPIPVGAARPVRRITLASSKCQCAYRRLLQSSTPATTTTTSQPARTPTPVSALPPASPAEVNLEFSDTTKLACLLCSRQFKTLDQLKRHTADSDLHKVR